MNIFEEILWPDFKRLPKVAKLPLNEQVSLYNVYLAELSMERYKNWLQYQPKGPLITETITPTPIESGFLLQEDLFDLLQEDGSNIIITTLP